MTLLRFGLPAVFVAVGLALVLLGGDAAVGAGVVIIGCAALVSLANLLVRFSLGEMQDRARDQEARDFYAAHGRWPDEPEPEAEAEAVPAPPAPSPPGAHPGIISRPATDPEGRTRPLRPRRPPRRPHQRP